MLSSDKTINTPNLVNLLNQSSNSPVDEFIPLLLHRANRIYHQDRKR